MTKFVLVQGDITNEKVQAIVNAANITLLGGGGVDGAIHKAAGPKLLEECRCLNGCETGQAKITSAYELPCEYVIHTPGPIWNGGGHGEKELLESCYKESLVVANKNKVRQIAFPSISTGIYHYPLKEAARIAICTAKKFVKENPNAFDEIKWVLYDDETYREYETALDEYNQAT